VYPNQTDCKYRVRDHEAAGYLIRIVEGQRPHDVQTRDHGRRYVHPSAIGERLVLTESPREQKQAGGNDEREDARDRLTELNLGRDSLTAEELREKRTKQRLHDCIPSTGPAEGPGRPVKTLSLVRLVAASTCYWTPAGFARIAESLLLRRRGRRGLLAHDVLVVPREIPLVAIAHVARTGDA